MVKQRKGSRAGQPYAHGSKVRSSRRRMAAEKAGVSCYKGLCDPAIRKAYRRGATPQDTFTAMGFAVDPNSATPSHAPFDAVSDPQMLEARQMIIDRAARGEKPRPDHPAEGEARVVAALIASYATNYPAMARDKRNSLQHTPKVLRRKCERYLASSS